MVTTSANQDMGPEFYKIVHASLNTTRNMRIPPDFVKHISQEERGIAVLEGPSGNIWRVIYSKQEDGSFLQDGWEDFVRDHSLGNYEFLLFRYDGDMCFHVQIFDKSACEREDSFFVEPHQVSHERNATPPKELEVVGRSSRGRGRGRPPKKNLLSERAGHRVPGRRVPTPQEAEKVLKTAKAFKSDVPFCLRCLSFSTVYVSYVMNLPPKFVKDHFPKVKKVVVLKNEQGKAWSVNFIPESNAFCGGWHGFAVDNQLEAGDICIFELVAELEICVHIFRCEID